MKKILSDERKALYIRALALAMPMMIQNGITNAVILVDSLMVGSLGTESTTGVSIGGQLIFVFNLAIFGALSGPGIFCAQYFGNNDVEGVRKTFRLKIWTILVTVLAGLAVFWFFGDFFIRLYLTGQAENIDPVLAMTKAREYIRIMLIGFFPFALTQAYSSTLRENNESFIPMVANICAVVTDVLFNYMLIFGKLGFPALGVQGAAIATVISRFVECSVIVIWSHLKREKYTFLKGVYRTLLVEKNVAIPVIKKSIPITVNEFLWSAGIITTNQLFSRRSLSVVPALGISNALTNVLNVVFVNMGAAVGIIIGQMLGAGEIKNIKKKASSLMWFTAFLSIGLSAILLAVAPLFPRIYDVTEDVKSMASAFIMIVAIFFPLQGFLNAQYFTIRSGGKTFITFLADSGFTWLVVVGVDYLLVKYTSLNIYVIFAISQALDLLKVLFGAYLIRKGIWITNLVKVEGKEIEEGASAEVEDGPGAF